MAAVGSAPAPQGCFVCRIVKKWAGSLSRVVKKCFYSLASFFSSGSPSLEGRVAPAPATETEAATTAAAVRVGVVPSTITEKTKELIIKGHGVQIAYKEQSQEGMAPLVKVTGITVDMKSLKMPTDKDGRDGLSKNLKPILTNSNGSPTEADLIKMENVIQDFQTLETKTIEEVIVNDKERAIEIKYKQDAFDPKIEHIYSVTAPECEDDTGYFPEVILFEGREDHEFDSEETLDRRNGTYFDQSNKSLYDLEKAISEGNIQYNGDQADKGGPEQNGLRCGSDRAG